MKGGINSIILQILRWYSRLMQHYIPFEMIRIFGMEGDKNLRLITTSENHGYIVNLFNIWFCAILERDFFCNSWLMKIFCEERNMDQNVLPDDKTEEVNWVELNVC